VLIKAYKTFILMQLFGTSNDIRLISNFVSKIYVMIGFNPTMDFVI